MWSRCDSRPFAGPICPPSSPTGGVPVSPGELYRIRISVGPTFGWKYIVDRYAHGAATFNGKPLLAQARSTFLFRTFAAVT
jgi:hypothetical protein